LTLRTHKIAAIGGDGVGPEVIEAGLKVLDALARRDGGFLLDVTRFDWGSELYRRTGRMMPADEVETLKGFDTIYFGAVGDPEIPDHITLWELRFAICQGLDQYANVRPTPLIGGRAGPLRPELGRQIDWVIVRENSEGEYAGVCGRAHAGLPLEVAMDVAVFTRGGVQRIARFAAELAMSRPRRRLTVVTKSNAQRHGLVLWDEICREVLRDFPELEVDWKLVDTEATAEESGPSAAPQMGGEPQVTPGFDGLAVAAPADGERDAVLTKELAPFRPDELAVGEQEPDGPRVEQPQVAPHQRDPLSGSEQPR
jgi:tartrate dehydrogenase/decarboxylase / D-malate dehydrogenase